MTHCLVVDDDPEIRASLQLLLQRFGMSVALAASGREMRERVAATRFDVVVRISAGEIAVVVDDRGPGIPPAQLDAVFEPFFRPEPSRNRDTGGTGLGLYIARELALRQGARIRLSNRAGGGLRAEVVLSRR